MDVGLKGQKARRSQAVYQRVFGGDNADLSAPEAIFEVHRKTLQGRERDALTRALMAEMGGTTLYNWIVSLLLALSPLATTILLACAGLNVTARGWEGGVVVSFVTMLGVGGLIGSLVWLFLARRVDPSLLLCAAGCGHVLFALALLPVGDDLSPYLVSLAAGLVGFVSAARVPIFLGFNFANEWDGDLAISSVRMGLIEAISLIAQIVTTGAIFFALFGRQGFKKEHEHTMAMMDDMSEQRANLAMLGLVYAVLMVSLSLLCLYGASATVQRMRLSVVPWRTMFTKARHLPFTLFSVGMVLRSALVFVGAVGIGFWFLASGAFPGSEVAEYSLIGVVLALLVTLAFSLVLYKTVDTGPVLLASLGGALPQALFVVVPLSIRAFACAGLNFRGEEDSMTDGQFWGIFLAAVALTQGSNLASGLLQMRLVDMRWTYITFNTIVQAASYFMAALSPWLFMAVVRAYSDLDGLTLLDTVQELPSHLGLIRGAVDASTEAAQTVNEINFTLALVRFCLPVSVLAMAVQSVAAVMQIRRVLFN